MYKEKAVEHRGGEVGSAAGRLTSYLLVRPAILGGFPDRSALDFSHQGRGDKMRNLQNDCDL